MYVNLLDRSIDELRETSGNTEAATGSTPGSVTAASGIAALQEAAGKTSADSTQASYRVYSQMVDMCIELIRQFYDMPRKFRILGQYGMERYVTYTNQGIQPQHQGNAFGQDMGYRLPVFDIKVSAQKKNVYTKVAQNELALQFFQLGFFNPQMVDQSLMCLEMMDFDDKDTIMQKIAQMGTMQQKLVQYMQLALQLATMTNPMLAEQIAQDVIQTNGGASMPMGGAAPQLMMSDNIGGIPFLAIQHLPDPSHTLIHGIAAFSKAKLVFPVGRNTILRGLVHFPGANLHFEGNAVFAHHRGMQRLVHIGLRS
jgi:hypothetical protein